MSAITDFQDRLCSGGLTFVSTPSEPGLPLGAGTNTFIGNWPVGPNNSVLMTGFPTPGPERVMGTGVAGVVFHNIHVQLQVRSKDYMVAEQMMKDILARMDNFVGAIGANTYLWINQYVGVSDYGQDENRRFRRVTTFMMRGPVP